MSIFRRTARRGHFFLSFFSKCIWLCLFGAVYVRLHFDNLFSHARRATRSVAQHYYVPQLSCLDYVCNRPQVTRLLSFQPAWFRYPSQNSTMASKSTICNPIVTSIVSLGIVSKCQIEVHQMFAMIEERTRVPIGCALSKSQPRARRSSLLPSPFRMPVTFHPAKHLAESRDVQPVNASQILRQACPNQWKEVDTIVQCSIGGQPISASDTEFKIVPNTNGFVNTVVSAWGKHHALVIRPDDVWLAIIAQFSFFVNGNAELLRANFVAHEGKKTLTVEGNLLDFALLSRRMGEMIHKNVLDPALCEWVLPSFSTTTPMDTTVGSMLMMATMKKYFDYRFGPSCGIPRVTLEGEQQD
ncbi:hypothetical protein MSAN_02298200 [Mycena sanguinolenta]|uniref:Uncharacterized protein n=1 Tax=Mycena sanguinolenta TaxID=230812 RepID=A0A8H6X9A5_9AGAR|nr:hypothetical protein MSAN_02298200 [Mycena sanguinolenta]